MNFATHNHTIGSEWMPNSHLFGNTTNSYARSAGMSASALPQVWSNNSAPAFQPFRSPQTKMLRHHHNQSVSHMNGWNRFKPAESFHRKAYEEGFPEVFSVAENGRSEFSHDNYVNNSRLNPNREPISLHMWIIKPVPDSHNICVEGKKNLSEENFWHSDVVTERLDEKTVVTAAGSLYRLEGNMELMDAMAVGFSRSIVESFWLGFPQDWKSLIATHFQTYSGQRDTVDQPESHNTDSEDDVSFVDNIDLEDTLTDDIDNKSMQSNTTKGSENYDEVVGADMECQLTENDDDIVVREAPADSQVDVEEASEEKASENVKTTPSKEKTTTTKVHTLSKWLIKFLADGKGIYVVGETENGSLWHSSAVEKRLSPRKVLSSSGSVYKLIGNMDKLLALNDGFPLELFNKFKNGFPKEWLEIIQEHVEGTHSQQETKKNTKAKHKAANQHKNSSKSVTKSKDNTKDTESKKTKSKSKLDKNVTPKSTKQAKSSSVKRDTKSRNRTMNSKSVTGHESTEEEEKFEARRLVITPRGQVVDLDNLGRSRSGRLIKPPLHSWVRQKVSVEGDNVVVHAPTTGASNFLKQFEDQYQNRSQKIKPYFNPRKKNVDYSILNSSRSRNSSILSNRMKGSAGNSDKRLKNNDTVITRAVNNSVTDPLSTEINIEVAVTEILENSRARRNRNYKKKTTCYDLKSCEDSNETNNVRIGDAYNLDVDETSDSLNRTLVSVTEIVDTDSDREDVRSRRTRQTGRKSVSHQRDTCSEDVTSKPRRTRNFDRSPFTENKDNFEDAACTKRSTRKSGNVNKDRFEGVHSTRSTRKSERLSGIGIRDINESSSKSSRQTEPVKDRHGKYTKIAVQGRAGKSRETNRNSHKTRKVISSDEEADEDCEVKVERPVRTRSSCGSNMNSSHRPRRACTKSVPVVQIISDSETDAEAFAGPKVKSQNRIQRKKDEKNVRNEALDEEWTAEEKEKLYMACKSVPVNQPKYWEKVADKVQTKSAESCNIMFYHTEKTSNSVKKAKKDTKAKPKVTALTAGVGTLKRKKQLQEILKQHNENYEDDLFNSTPFRQTRKRKIPIINDLSDSLFEELARKQGRAFETPKGAGNIEGTDVSFASPEKTPGTHLNADMTDQSVDMDGYVHNMVKRKKKGNGKKRARTISETPKPIRPNKSLSPSMKLFHKYLNESISDKENHEDSENEADYYWDEEAEEMTQ